MLERHDSYGLDGRHFLISFYPRNSSLLVVFEGSVEQEQELPSLLS